MTTDTKTAESSHLDSLVLLRGIAAALVCFCHISGALIGADAPKGILNFLLLYGKYGVHIFFVISGFVIPLSLLKGNYGIPNYFTFLYKRLLRLHPPYLLALGLTLVIMYSSYHVRHVVFPETVQSIIRECFYLNIPADNPVFWSLAVEAQYYIFIGLFFWVLHKYPKLTALALVPLLVILCRLPVGLTLISLFQYFLIFFLMGIVVFLIYAKIGKPLINYLVLMALIIFSLFFYDFASAIVSSATVLVILYLKKPIPSFFGFYGKISYSLYLIHVPVGVKLINLSKRYFSSSYNFVLFLIVFGIVTLISWGFWRLIEVPSERISRKIKYASSK